MSKSRPQYSAWIPGNAGTPESVSEAEQNWIICPSHCIASRQVVCPFPFASTALPRVSRVNGTCPANGDAIYSIDLELFSDYQWELNRAWGYFFTLQPTFKSQHPSFISELIFKKLVLYIPTFQDYTHGFTGVFSGPILQIAFLAA